MVIGTEQAQPFSADTRTELFDSKSHVRHGARYAVKNHCMELKASAVLNSHSDSNENKPRAEVKK